MIYSNKYSNSRHYMLIHATRILYIFIIIRNQSYFFLFPLSLSKEKCEVIQELTCCQLQCRVFIWINIISIVLMKINIQFINDIHIYIIFIYRIFVLILNISIITKSILIIFFDMHNEACNIKSSILRPYNGSFIEILFKYICAVRERITKKEKYIQDGYNRYTLMPN